jgi:hypothetical protein
MNGTFSLAWPAPAAAAAFRLDSVICESISVKVRCATANWQTHYKAKAKDVIKIFFKSGPEFAYLTVHIGFARAAVVRLQRWCLWSANWLCFEGLEYTVRDCGVHSVHLTGTSRKFAAYAYQASTSGTALSSLKMVSDAEDTSA